MIQSNDSDNGATPHEAPQARVAREARALEQRWKTDTRWNGIRRDYSAEDVLRLRGSVRVGFGRRRSCGCVCAATVVCIIRSAKGSVAKQVFKSRSRISFSPVFRLPRRRAPRRA